MYSKNARKTLSCVGEKKKGGKAVEIINRLKKDTSTRNKLIGVTAILFILMIGYKIPLPGIDTEYLKTWTRILSSSGAGGFLNAMTGSSFENMSIFALSITPYITASIIVQLLTALVPVFERMRTDGSVGRKKIEKLTYMVGAIVALLESVALAIGLGKQGLFVDYAWYTVLYATVVWTSGACFLIWIGETITNKLIGNGISLILLFNILSSMPGSIIGMFDELGHEKSMWVQVGIGILIAIALFAVFAYVVILNNAEKRLRITNSAKASGGMMSANENVLPLKLNMGGVMPIIFSSSIMSITLVLAQMFKVDPESWTYRICQCLNQNMWFRPDHPLRSIGIPIFIILTFAFSYFYSLISFNTKDIADNLRKSGSVINGVRPGQATADYLTQQAKSLFWIGTSMLIIISLLPTLISGLFNINSLSFGGTTVIIIVGTLLEMRNIVISQTSSVAYKSLVRRKKKK